MSRWTPHDDLEDEDWDDGPDDAESSVAECPKCGADIYEDAVRCPICGDYVTRSTSPWPGRPMWWRLLGLAGVIAVIAGILLAGGL
jgi:hypothetical protein